MIENGAKDKEIIKKISEDFRKEKNMTNEKTQLYRKMATFITSVKRELKTCSNNKNKPEEGLGEEENILN